MTSPNAEIEYQIRPVTRYIITRFTSGRTGENSGSVEGRGEYDNADVAYEVAYALAKTEHDRLGWPAFDDRMRYPRHPSEVAQADPRLVEVAAACAGVPVTGPTL